MIHPRRVTLLWFSIAAVLTSAVVSSAPVARRYEAESVVVNRGAWQVDRYSETHWNLWSTDKDAEKKWSEGIVLQSPRVMQEREGPADGAPPLHLRITDLPNGVYNVGLEHVSRILGVSHDGETWSPTRGGLVLDEVEVTAGVLEFWVDDRYAMEDRDRRGSGYLDVVVVYPYSRVEDGVANGGFEEVEEGIPVAWGWWSREGHGAAASTTDAVHAGERAVRLTHDGELDWAYSCTQHIAVVQGDELAVSAAVNAPAGQNVELAVVGLKDGNVSSWSIGGRTVRGKGQWQETKGYLRVPRNIDDVYVRFTGRGTTDVLIDEVALRRETFQMPTKPPVDGWATERVWESLDRGVVAAPTETGVYVGWRLLTTDTDDTGFDVYRRYAGDAQPVKVNREPVVRTTDLLDQGADPARAPTYEVRPAGSQTVLGRAACEPDRQGTAYRSLKLADEETVFQKVAVCDLDADHSYDYVIKQPAKNIDPWVKYWYKSPETFKLEAYRHDGTALWRKDLGWGIERGIWYSPYIAWDLDGDGRAEVAAKIGEGDPRDEDGRVTSGPEWLVVWDGATGEERGRVPWPSRDGFRSYNLASRNQIAVAYLDGKTPCLLALRGTYARMMAHAYHLNNGKLERLWTYDNDEYAGRHRGQGAHFTSACDVDGDGRDEVILGSLVLDDTGAPLWSTGKGHPDAHYLGDIDPARPGLELAYVMETRQHTGGLCLADAATGELLWELDTPTRHVHGKGLCADIDPTVPGQEVYGMDADGHAATENRWMFSASGDLLASGPEELPFGFSLTTAFWDADLQKEIVRGHITDFRAGRTGDRISGSVRLVADVLGDWREEIIASVAGELRIYTTTIPATDRRPCLMQDRPYRLDAAMNAMGYNQNPMLSYAPDSRAPNLSLRALADQEPPIVEVAVSAPADRGVEGTVTLTGADGLALERSGLAVALAPGESQVTPVAITASGTDRISGSVRAELRGRGGDLHRTVTVPVIAAGGFLKARYLCEAEAFSGQTGGEVQRRDDKANTRGQAISHWDDIGHRLAWRITAPAGRYHLILRYCTPKDVVRTVTVDEGTPVEVSLPETGGFGNVPWDWDHATVSGPDGPLVFELTAGDHTISLENRCGHGCNLDYIALVPVAQ